MTSSKSSFLFILALYSITSFSLPQLRQPAWPSTAQAGVPTIPSGNLATIPQTIPQPIAQVSPSTYRAPSTTQSGLFVPVQLKEMFNFDWVKRFWQDHIAKKSSNGPSTQMAIASEAQGNCNFPQVSHEGSYNNFPTPNPGLDLKGKLTVPQGKGYVLYECKASAIGNSNIPMWARVGARAELYDLNNQHVATYFADFSRGLQGPPTVKLVNQKNQKVIFNGLETERVVRRRDIDPAIIKSSQAGDSRVVYRLNNKGGKQIGRQSCQQEGAQERIPLQAEMWLYAESKAAGFPGLPNDNVQLACANTQGQTSSTRASTRT